MAPKVSILGSKSALFHLIFLVFKLVFALFQYDTYDNGTFRTYFCTFERLFLTLPMLKLAILKTWDFGNVNFWFCTFKTQAQHFIIMQMNIHRPIEYIWDKQISTVLLNKLVPYLWQLESHRTHHFGVTNKAMEIEASLKIDLLLSN